MLICISITARTFFNLDKILPIMRQELFQDQNLQELHVINAFLTPLYGPLIKLHTVNQSSRPLYRLVVGEMVICPVPAEVRTDKQQGEYSTDKIVKPTAFLGVKFPILYVLTYRLISIVVVVVVVMDTG